MMLVLNIALFFVVFCFASVNCGRILFITMPNGRSHIISMLPLAYKLQEDYGHNVTVLCEVESNQELSFKGGVNVELVQWKNISQNVLALFKLDDPHIQNIFWTQDQTAISLPLMWAGTVASASHLLKHQKEDVKKIANQTWDLIILDHLFAVAGISLVKTTNATYIHYFTAMVHPLYAYYKGLARPLSAAPITAIVSRHDTPFWDANNFVDRMIVLGDSFSFMLVYWIIVQSMIKYAVSSDFTFGQFYDNDLLAVYGYFDLLDFPMPTSSHFVSAGVGVSCGKSPKPLPPELDSFVNDSQSFGTIIMAFGTMIRWDMAPEQVKKDWVDILSQLKEFRIVWAIRYLEEGRKTIGHRLPAHVMLTGWIPQTDLLAHKNTKLFITHGGLKSLKEAICAELPALFLPLFGEQQRNAFLAKTLGFGEYVNKKDINPENVVNTIRKMIFSLEYYSKVKKTKKLWLDRVIPALDEAAFKVNQVLKYKGLSKKNSYINFESSWLRYLYLDVLILLFVCATLVVID